MSIKLLSVQFRGVNRVEVMAPLLGSLGTQAVPIPEWTAPSVDPALSPFAPIVSRMAGASFQIRAEFQQTGSETQIEVSAIDSHPTPILGTQSFIVDFSGGNTVKVDVTVTLSDMTVSASSIDLRWRFRMPSGTVWSEFGRSAHRLFTLIDEPGPPWDTDPAVQASWLWTEVLEIVCHQGQGANSTDQVAAAMTDWLFKLGAQFPGGFLSYGWSGLTSTDHFDCAGFLSVVSAGKPHAVACIDTAAVLSTFANAAGCRLWQAEMTCGSTNPIIVIGDQRPCPTAFGFHEVAWGGQATASDRIWDGLLMLNGNNNPGSADFQPLLSEGLQFRNRSIAYCDRLLAPGFAARSRPQGINEGGNRRFGPIYPFFVPTELDVEGIFRRRHPELAGFPNGIRETHIFGGALLNQPRVSDFQLQDLALEQGTIHSKWRADGSFIDVRAILMDTASVALKAFKYRLLSVPDVLEVINDLKGHAVFAPSGAAYFTGNLVVFILNERERVKELVGFVSAMDQFLMNTWRGQDHLMEITDYRPINISPELADQGGYRLESDTGILSLINGSPHYSPRSNKAHTVRVSYCGNAHRDEQLRIDVR